MHGSVAMRTQLMVLDRDPAVAGLAARPVRLVWRDPGDGRTRSWVPQVFARYADGSGLLADCPAIADAGGARARRAAQIVEAACAQVGWTYRRLAPPDPVTVASSAGPGPPTPKPSPSPRLSPASPTRPHTNRPAPLPPTPRRPSGDTPPPTRHQRPSTRPHQQPLTAPRTPSRLTTQRNNCTETPHRPEHLRTPQQPSSPPPPNQHPPKPIHPGHANTSPTHSEQLHTPNTTKIKNTMIISTP